MSDPLIVNDIPAAAAAVAPAAAPAKIKIKVKISKKVDVEKTTNEVVVPAESSIKPITSTYFTDLSSNAEKPTCAICMDHYTSKLRRCLSCPYCNECICSQCLEKYLLNTIEDPHCVNCRKGWNQSLLQTFCTKTFLTKTYADYRSNILLNRSKSFLPRYQEQAERVRAASKYRDQSSQLVDELNKLTLEQRQMQLEFEKKRADLWRKNGEICHIANQIESGQRDLEGKLVDNNTPTQQDNSQERKKFVRHCPAEGCNGFLSSAWKCGLCSNWTCPDCFVVKGENRDIAHTCTSEDKATADEIRKRTKPCPNCGELIEKAEGCDQMFCTSCHSPFSWTRGEIIKTGIIHNPHYFEWLNRNGGVAGRHHMDIPCGGLPTYGAMFSHIRNLRKKVEQNKNDLATIHELKKNTDYIHNAYMTCGHIIDVERNRWTAHTRPNDDSELGVSFLLNRITQDEWRNRLKINERSRIKSKEVRDILDAFNNAAIDIWRQIDGELRDNTVTSDNFEIMIRDWCGHLEQLRSFVNPPLLEISRIYNCSVPQITDKFLHTVTSVTKIRNEAKKAAAEAAEAAERN